MTAQTTLPAQGMTYNDCDKPSGSADDPGLITVAEIRRAVEDIGNRVAGS